MGTNNYPHRETDGGRWWIVLTSDTPKHTSSPVEVGELYRTHPYCARSFRHINVDHEDSPETPVTLYMISSTRRYRARQGRPFRTVRGEDAVVLVVGKVDTTQSTARNAYCLFGKIRTSVVIAGCYEYASRASEKLQKASLRVARLAERGRTMCVNYYISVWGVSRTFTCSLYGLEVP